MATRITILGSGNSTGVPSANGDWGKCDPSEPRNRRRRASILIEREGTAVLVDAGPDLHEQMLNAGVKKIDAVILTHAHADHTQGIDDLRAFVEYGGTPLPMFAYPEILEQINVRFPYMFGGTRSDYYNKPFLRPVQAEPELRIGALDFRLFEQDHTVCRTIGIRTGAFAYSTDIKNLNDDAFAALSGVRTWAVAAIRREPHVAHAHLDVVLSWIERVRPEQAWLTHMNFTMDYRTLLATLPPGVEPAYDGKIIEDDG